MKVSLEITGPQLVLLYLATGNEDAGSIVLAAAREYAKLHPPERKRRKLRPSPPTTKERQE